MAALTTGLAMASMISTALRGVNVLRKTSDVAGDITNNKSLTDIVKMSRVQPLTVVDNDLVHWENLPDVLQTALSIFTGYYLQAVSILGSIDTVKVVKTLNALNPNQDSMFSLETFKDRMESENEGSWKMASESYKWALPKTKNQMAFEAVTSVIGKDETVNVRDLTNLAIGKMINVTLSDSNKGENKINMPVSIRLSVSTIPSRSLESILTLNSIDKTLVERFHAWRSGQIEFVKDLILCQDMIDERKKLLMKDKSGVYSAMVQAATNNTMRGLTRNNPSMAASSNIVVISDTTAKEVEHKLGGKLSDPRTRTQVFESGYMMLLIIVDKQFDRVTFYHRGIASPTSMGLRDIKISNKNNGPDIMDILKAFGQGSAPSL